MKQIILLFAIAVSASVFAASPAATQQWVRNYVSTNTTAGGGVSQQWVIDYVTSVISNVGEYAATTTSGADYQTRAQNAVAMAIVEASMSGLHALTFSHLFPSNTFANVKMADAPSGNGWTNVVYGCGVVTNADRIASLTLNATNYVCSVFSNYTSRNVFTYMNGAITNEIIVLYTSVSTNDWKTARGDN